MGAREITKKGRTDFKYGCSCIPHTTHSDIYVTIKQKKIMYKNRKQQNVLHTNTWYRKSNSKVDGLYFCFALFHISDSDVEISFGNFNEKSYNVTLVNHANQS